MTTIPIQYENHTKHCRMNLGTLEAQVMNVLWKAGECSVRQVRQLLRRPIAHTTVMTTLVRLFHKGLLERRRDGRKFFYCARLSAEQWGRLAAAESISRFLATPNLERELLVSCLVEAIFEQDRTLLWEAEKKIFALRRPQASQPTDNFTA